MREFQLIEKYFKPLTKSHQAAQNLQDDVAKIKLKADEELVVSKDIFVEDVHFLRSQNVAKIAAKLLLTNISDLAASGAKPLHYLLGFSKNNYTDARFLRQFVSGLKSVQDQFQLSLIGGDTVAAKKLFFSITIFGIIKKGKILLRNQAQDGDLIFVSGTIGDAFLGLKGIKNKYLQQRHFLPSPRVELGKQLLDKNLSRCAIDVSDGLLADLNHICQSSQVSAEIFLDKVPFSEAAKKTLQNNSQIKITDLICGGDDYELIFAVNPKNHQKILQLAQNLKLDLTCIGSFVKATNKKFSVTLFDQKNHKITIKKSGYEH
ncbi:MAG: thiamine-phosphate kinase [Rickettsiales bacterium]|nr:thiamine-phosphate kinase [Rickettsiales bacterium]